VQPISTQPELPPVVPQTTEPPPVVPPATPPALTATPLVPAAGTPDQGKETSRWRLQRLFR
jgi:hypothetical protein